MARTWRVILIGLFLALASAVAAALAGFGSRWGWWSFRTGFDILKAASVGGLSSAVLCGLGLSGSFRGRAVRAGIAAASAGLLIGLVTAGLPLSWLVKAKSLPMIHDITTDTQNPPQFVAILPLRSGAPNPARYGGPEVAARQIRAYPGVRPLGLKLPAPEAFDRALETARGMGWEIVAADRAGGRIEATDTTFWFGFKDDVVIRVTPEGAASRIDLRSVSRVGMSDVGTNARRIEAFLKRLKQ